MPGFLLPCLQLAFWPGCLLLCGLMEPPVPFSQAPIWQTKQVQLHLKNHTTVNVKPVYLYSHLCF